MNTKKLAIGLLLAVAASVPAQNLATWTKYKSITVNTTGTGANVAANVAKFPVLIRLSAANAADIFAQAQPGGSDIRFSNAAGTAVIPHEIESWDGTAQRAAIWVLADTVKGNNNTASMRIYWGKGGVADGSNGAAVFDTANGHVAVWHMNGTATEKSSTVHGFVATPFGAPGANDTSIVGRGRRFNGAQHFQVVGSASGPLNLPLDGTYTLSAWTYADTVITASNSGHGIVNKGDHQWTLATYGSAADKTYEITTKAGNNQWRQTTTAATTTPVAYPGVLLNNNVRVWRYVTGTWNGTDANDTGRIYFDGVHQKFATWNNTSTAGRQEARDVHIGGLSNEGTGSTNATGSLQRFWVGTLDEIRVSKVARDSNWIRLEFENQKPASSIVTLGSTQTQTVAADTVRNIRYVMPGTGNTPRDTLVFPLNVAVNLPLLYDGGPIDSVKITGFTTTLPAGLSINLTSGLLSGTPTATFAAANRTLTVYTALGNVTRGLRISAVFVPGPMANFDYAVDTAQYVVGLPIAANAPSWSDSGRAPTGFSVTPALPAGLSLNATTGVISGTATAIAAATNHTVTATNATDTLTKVIRITVVSAGTENYAGTAWPNKQVVYLNTQGSGAAVSGGVANFPVLIRLDSSNFNTGFTQAQASGADIRFTKANNTTRLSHQIERWDAAAKKAEVWVRLDTIRGNAIDSVRMHWGNATAPNLSSGPTVFDTVTGFQAVWHMNAASGAESDATPNGFGASATNGPGTGAGAIGPARTFNGTSQFFVAPGTASGKLNFSQADSYTLSSWINPASIVTTTNNGHKIIDKGDNQYVLATYGPDETSRYWEITIRGNNAWNQCQADGSFPGSTAILASSSVNAWNYLVGTYAGGAVGAAATQRLFYNGVLVNECPITNDSPDGRNENHNVHIGVQSGTAPSGNFTRYWNGLLDEVRLASRARSADWVKLEYANQRPAGQNLVSFTRPVSVAGPLASVQGSAFTVASAGRGLVFGLGVAAEGRATVSLVDMWGRTVWSGAFAPGASRLQWNGTVRNGAYAANGVYLARVTIADKQGRAVQVFDRKVPYTR